MRIWAEIDLDNLKNNLNIIRNIIGNVEILGVIKANAYGHGAIEVADALHSSGVNFFGVACVDEAEELLNNGINADILILGSIPNEEWERAVSLGVQLTLSSYEDLEFLKKSNLYPRVHIKIDTGMGRIGFKPDVIKEVINEIKEKKIAKIEGIFTHLSSADDCKEYTKNQMKIFEKIADQFEIKYKHMLNSAGILNFDNKFNLVRPGIILYGSVPFENKYKEKFKPVMSLKSKIVFIKQIEEDIFISYGRTFKANKGEIIATVSAGYADGINRRLSNKGELVLRGIKCSIVGRICMDQLMIKIPKEMADVKVGEIVTIIGDGITVEEIADKVETISYEILTGINNRVPRLYKRLGEYIEIKSLLGRKLLFND